MINAIIKELDKYPNNKPIYADELFKLVTAEKLMKREIFNVYLARLAQRGMIARHEKGVYFKPVRTVFGNTKLNRLTLFQEKFLKTKNGIVGFITGPTFLNRIGLTTQESRLFYIATNQVENAYTDQKANVFITKAPMDVDDTNYKYYQLLFALRDIEKYHFDIDQPYKILSEYIEENKLDYRLLLKYAGKLENQGVLCKLALIALV